MPAGQHIPTNYANMFSCLFPIHPIASTNMPDFLDGICTICQESFKDSAIELIVQLYCDHAHHFTVKLADFSYFHFMSLLQPLAN